MGLFDLFKSSGSSSSKSGSSTSKKSSAVSNTGTNQVPSSKKSSSDPIEALATIHETVSILEKKMESLEEKIKIEHNKAKENATTNKTIALAALKRKKNYETQMENIQKNILRLEEQAVQLETVSLSVETTFALQKSVQAQKAIQNQISVDNLQEVVQDLQEFQDRQREVEDIMASLENPEHEDDINEELNDLIEEKISEDLLVKMPAPLPTTTAAVSKKPVQKAEIESFAAPAADAVEDEENELEELKRSLAL